MLADISCSENSVAVSVWEGSGLFAPLQMIGAVQGTSADTALLILVVFQI